MTFREINKIDVLCGFEGDEEAVEQVIKDGVKLIPIEELSENFERKYLGRIDTPKNKLQNFVLRRNNYMRTLRDFWNNADGCYNFVNLNGDKIDDMDYPIETEVLNVKHIKGEEYEVTLNVL